MEAALAHKTGQSIAPLRMARRQDEQRARMGFAKQRVGGEDKAVLAIMR